MLFSMQWRAEPVAQSVEHVTFNHGVAGSSPAGLANNINNLGPYYVVMWIKDQTNSYRGIDGGNILDTARKLW